MYIHGLVCREHFSEVEARKRLKTTDKDNGDGCVDGDRIIKIINEVLSYIQFIFLPVATSPHEVKVLYR